MSGSCFAIRFSYFVRLSVVVMVCLISLFAVGVVKLG